MKTIMVDIGGIAVSGTRGDIIKTKALGSCVGLIIISEKQKVAGMAHVTLPESKIDNGRGKDLPGYYADTAIPAMLAKFRKYGVDGSKGLIVKLAGGANVMDPDNVFNIGKRNVPNIRKILWQNRLVPRVEYVGGSISRTVWLEVDTGRVFVSSPGREQREL